MPSTVHSRNMSESKDFTIHMTDEDQTLEKYKNPKASYKRKSLVRGVKEICGEFCSDTSIHGFQYFGQQRPRKEICFWIIVFVILIYLCSSIIVRIYVKWRESPVIVSFSDHSTPIWNIPFPRVTICPEVKRSINVSSGKNFTSDFNRTQLEDTLTLMHMCDAESLLEEEPLLRDMDFVRSLKRMLPEYDRYLLLCYWSGDWISCDRLFYPVYTDEGICYAFNSLEMAHMYRDDVVKNNMREVPDDEWPIYDTGRWSLEEGYAAATDLDTYPRRLANSGAHAGLVVYLQCFPHELDYTCNGPMEGYKVMLHSPDDVPSVSKHFVRISMDKEVMIALKPKMITTSPEVAAYEPAKRLCFMNKDRQLAFYKIYSQKNCERECLTNYTLKECGCVHFSMPRSNDTPVCLENNIDCQLYAQRWMSAYTLATVADTPSDDCNCLPACTSLEYETEISEGYYDAKALKGYKKFYKYDFASPGGKTAVVSIYFKEIQFITSRRSEVYGFTDLLANFGGVFGLFMGISILSVVEIIYHLSLRLWSNLTHGVGES
uniref:Pickpocket protein 28-like n=1 Tax=Stomoxys calcitrans TaxID=35570 RepID=A0A1I8PG23_STOCA